MFLPWPDPLGNNGKWKVVEHIRAEISNRVMCKVGKNPGYPQLKDVLPGDDRKHCECEVSPSSAFFQTINILALPKAERDQMQLNYLSSCSILSNDTSLEGRSLWAGVEGICSKEWASSKYPKGPRARKQSSMGMLLKTVLDKRFVGNYDRLSQAGWVRRGFVTCFIGSALNGGSVRSVELLIDSVHKYSVYPIVVLHAGMATPFHWTAEVYPRLILVSMADFPSELSTTHMSLLASLVSRVKSGILLPHDALVLPTVDTMFSRIESEINEDYALPCTQFNINFQQQEQQQQ